jgi:hypothetical protein
MLRHCKVLVVVGDCSYAGRSKFIRKTRLHTNSGIWNASACYLLQILGKIYHTLLLRQSLHNRVRLLNRVRIRDVFLRCVFDLVFLFILL